MTPQVAEAAPMSVLEMPVVLQLVSELAGIRLSPEEFDAVEACDELYTYELVHGVPVVRHHRTLANVNRTINSAICYAPIKSSTRRELRWTSRGPSIASSPRTAAAVPTASSGLAWAARPTRGATSRRSSLSSFRPANGIFSEITWINATNIYELACESTGLSTAFGAA